MPHSVRNVSMVLLAALLMMAGAAPAIAASLTVEWDGNTTDGDLAGYRVYMASNASVFQLTPAAARAQATTRDVTGTSTVFTGLTAGTTYWFGVTAYDTSGNESGFSNIASGVPADTSAPVVSIASPSAGANVSGTISIAANATDDVGVVGVRFRVDGADVGTEDSSNPWSIAWDTTGIADGAHTLVAVARDAAGNTTTSASVGVTVQNDDVTPPSVSITAPAGGATVSGTISITANASDDEAVAGVQFRLDGVNVGPEDTTAPYLVAWDTSTAADGAHTLTALARDTSGNTWVSAGVSVTVSNPDTTGPTVSLTSPASGATLSGTVSLTATAADGDGVAGVRFQVDGADIGTEDTSNPYSRSWNTNSATEGTHVLTAIARDTAGNTTTSAPVTITVDNADDTAPTVSITAPANNASVSGTVTLTASASDDVGVVGVRFRVNGADVGSEDTSAPYTAAWDTTGLANGTYTLTAVARDAAGNTKTSATITVTVANADTTPPAPPGNLRVRP